MPELKPGQVNLGRRKSVRVPFEALAHVLQLPNGSEVVGIDVDHGRRELRVTLANDEWEYLSWGLEPPMTQLNLITTDIVTGL